MKGEAGLPLGGEQDIAAEGRLVPGNLDRPADNGLAGGEVTPLIKFAVVRQKHLGDDAEQPSAMDDDPAIIEMTAMPYRRPDDKDREELGARRDQPVELPD